MDFQLSDEQVLLRDTTRSMLSGYDTETRNKVIETDPGFNPEVWKQLADIGILGLGFDPQESGPLEIMVVLTEIGRMGSAGARRARSARAGSADRRARRCAAA